MNALFSIENVSSGYGKNTVLNNISFKIFDGEFLGIIGPNGSGKTTLLKNITRALGLFSGNILYKGTNIFNIKLSRVAREIAFVPQETHCTFSFSVLDIVLMGRYPHMSRFRAESREDYHIARESLKTVKCLGLADKYIDEISAGEKQRVIIAKALAQEPSVLVLDEPTSLLDIGHRIEIFDLIKRLNKERRISVVSVLHDLNLAGDYCSRLILMDAGRIYKKGPVEEILTYQNLENVYKTAILVKNSPATGKPHIIPIPGYKN